MGRDYPAKPIRKMDTNASDMQEAMNRLKEAGFEPRDMKGLEIQIPRLGEPMVHYFPLIARWREAGNPTRHYGPVGDLILWLKGAVK